MKAAWIFPGQGSHHIGMAGEWARASDCAREALEEAAEVLGFDLPRLMAEGPEDQLSDTYNQQPALLAASVAILRAAFDSLPEPGFVAGHSLGEYSALVAAGALSYPDALLLVRERGRLMKLAGEQSPGRMAAILGLEDAVVEAACERIPGAEVANYNAPGQVVISGTNEAVDAAVLALDELGAARTVVLPITIAAHSTLMASAAEPFAELLEGVALAPASVPVLANLSARPIQAPEALRAELTGQLTGSVRWSDSVLAMAEAGVTDYYEIGSGRVLTGLVKRILRGREGPKPSLHAMATPPSRAGTTS
jgi:[acyl-carrier-protein] S-malonyltransferase